MLEQFRREFDYDHWATGLCLGALSEMSIPPEKAVKILGHIAFAKDVWLARLLKEDLSRFTTPWPPYSLRECGEKLALLHAKWHGYLAGLDPAELESRVQYRNTQGKLFEQIVRNVMAQVVFHSHYHRGQLAALIHEAGGKRPGTDYISHAFETGEAKEL